MSFIRIREMTNDDVIYDSIDEEVTVCIQEWIEAEMSRRPKVPERQLLPPRTRDEQEAYEWETYVNYERHRE